MNNCMRLLVLMSALSFCNVPTVLGSTQSSGNPDMDDPLLWAPLIVRGEIVDIEESASTMEEWGAHVSSPVNIVVESIRVRVTSIVKGSYTGAYLEVAAFSYLHGDDAAPYEIGNEVVVAAFYNSATARFHLRNYLGLLIRHGETWLRPRDVITNGATPLSLSMTIREIEARVDSMSGDSVAAAAELVVSGRLLAVESRGSLGAQQRCWTLSVNAVLKGELSGDRVEFFMPKQGTLPEWAVPVPDKARVGETWVVFLRRRENAWIPFAGVNGMFRLERDRLLYEGTVDIGLNVAGLRHLIEASQ